MSTKRILSILAVLFLIGTASAAVFVTFNPEAKLFFEIDKPSDAEAIVTYAELSSGGWSNSIVVPVNDTIVDVNLQHRNPRSINLVGNVTIKIECDEGLDIATTGTIYDFTTIEYTDINGTIHSCNTVDMIQSITSNTVTFVPIGEYVFGPGYSSANIRLNLVGRAYGNYIIEILVEEV